MTDEFLSLGFTDRDRLNAEFGGLPRGSIVLVEGNYGAGKSSLSQRFCRGVVEEGHTATYLSTELSVGDFIDQMHSLSYDVTRPLLEEDLLFLRADVDTAGLDDGDRRNLLRRLREAEVMWRADVVVVDTFDDILRNDPTFESLVRQDDGRQAGLQILSFFRELTSQGKVIVLTVDPSTMADDVLEPFRGIADVHLRLQMIEVGNETRRQISVERFTGNGERVGDVVGYSVRSGVGIVIESRNVA